MDYYFYKHSLNYQYILNELKDNIPIFNNTNIFTYDNNDLPIITNTELDFILSALSEENTYPEFVTNTYEDNNNHLCNTYPEFVTNTYEDNNNHLCNTYPEFVSENYTNIDDILNDESNELDKLYGDYDDWEDYIDSIYN